MINTIRPAPLWRPAAQNIELMAQNRHLCLKPEAFFQPIISDCPLAAGNPGIELKVLPIGSPI
jgi:hypothetical protein